MLTGWLSVDPKADKYSSFSPYAYCAWNPIVYIDSNGMEYTDWPKIGRYAKGALNVVSGAFTVAGGIVIGTGGSVLTGGAAAPVGFFVVGTGAYEIAEGFHTIVNALSGTPQSSDPKYTTPLGAATNNTTVDVATSIVVGLGSTTVTAFGRATTATSNAVRTTQNGVKTSAEGAQGGTANTIMGYLFTTSDIAYPLITTPGKSREQLSSHSTDESTNNTSQRNGSSVQSSDNSSRPFCEW